MAQQEASEAARRMLLIVETDFHSAVVSGDAKECPEALWKYIAEVLRSTNLKHVAMLAAIAASWSAYQIMVCKRKHKKSGLHMRIRFSIQTSLLLSIRA